MDDSPRTFFITTVTWQRVPIFRVESRARLLIEVLRDYRNQGRIFAARVCRDAGPCSCADHACVRNLVRAGGAIYQRWIFLSSAEGREDSGLAAEFHESSDSRRGGLRETLRIRAYESGSREIGCGSGTVCVLVGESGVPAGCDATGAEAHLL